MKVYLSHSEQEKNLARRLAEELTRAGVSVWPPADSSPSGGVRSRRSSKALHGSDAMVVLISPASARSATVQSELGFALQSPRYRRRLLPVVVRETAEMPWILNRLAPIRPGRNRRRLGKTILRKLRGK